MSLGGAGGSSPGSQGDRGRPAEQAGVIEEIDLHDAPRVRATASLWDQLLIGLFFVAIAGGLLIAIASGGGDLEAAESSPSIPPPAPSATPRPESFSFWQRTAEAYERRSDIGQQYPFWCPSSGTLLDVYGTRVYASNSSVCTAAVHWGLISVEDGGLVTIEMRRGRTGHRGSQRNGVASATMPGQWPSSFVFVEPVSR